MYFIFVVTRNLVNYVLEWHVPRYVKEWTYVCVSVPDIHSFQKVIDKRHS
jgi:hypothetical protein